MTALNRSEAVSKPLAPRDVAEILGCSYGTALALMRSNQIKSWNIGLHKKLRLQTSREELERFVKKGGTSRANATQRH